MNRDNQEAIYCEDDGECIIYCNICDKLCIERFYRKNLKSQTHTDKFHKKRTIKKIFISNSLI